jgi:uncharacterized protein
MIIEIKETKKLDFKKPVLIEGFPGVGMIGTISTFYLVEKLGLELIGEIVSSHFPPVTSIHNFKPLSPARIYGSADKDVIVLFSEFVIPAEIVYSLTNAIIDYADSKKVRTIYSFAGIGVENPPDTIYGIASTDSIGEELKKSGVSLIKEGATQGVSGVLISQCALRNFPAANLLIPTDKLLDPRSSARLLDSVKKMLGFDLNTDDLVKEADEVEKKIKGTFDKMKSMNQDYKNFQEQQAIYD